METSLEITDKFQITGTVGKVESMETKGGGWQFKVVCNDAQVINKLAIARGRVCVFDVGVSVNGNSSADNMDTQEELEFDGSVG